MSLGRVLARISEVGVPRPGAATPPILAVAPPSSPVPIPDTVALTLPPLFTPDIAQASAPARREAAGASTPALSSAEGAVAPKPVPDPGLVAELGRLNDELMRCETKYRELNERYMRNRAAALALGAIYLRIRKELSRLKKDPKQPRKLTDPSRLLLIERTRMLIEEHELRALSGGRMSPDDADANW